MLAAPHVNDNWAILSVTEVDLIPVFLCVCSLCAVSVCVYVCGSVCQSNAQYVYVVYVIQHVVCLYAHMCVCV